MIWLVAIAWAQDGAPLEARAETVRPHEAEPGLGLSYLGFVQARANATNIATTNPFFDGQLVGQLEGSNGTQVQADARALYTEFRATGFLTYAPPVLGGRAELVAGYEVDFAFGDQSYGVGGNTGGGFGADQVNLQTRRLYAGFRPDLGHDVHVMVGQQFVNDGVHDPTASGADALFRSGGRLMFFGSEAAGVSWHGRVETDWGDRVLYRAGAFTLSEGALSEADDVALIMADVAVRPAYGLELGAHAWHVRDRSGGSGGVLGQGPGSPLSGLQGGPMLDLRANGDADPQVLSADLVWLGADAGLNADLSKGPLGAHALVVGNLGRLYVDGATDVDVRGLLASGEVRARYAPGRGSVARLGAVYASGDDPDDDVYSGVITGNSYGVVGAVHASHGLILLHPDGLAINRQVALLPDVSTNGRGMVSLTGSLGYDPIPDRLTVQVAGGTAFFGEQSAQEVDVSVVGSPLLFLQTGVTGAYLAKQGTDAWMVYAHLNWLVF